MQSVINVHTGKSAAKIDDRLYSSFIEHMGRAVYTGIYEPSHPSADPDGFRQDTAELIRPLALSHIRYPGGNFLSGYDWKDGIGSKSLRPTRPELARSALEPNKVGTDEFLQWCEQLGVSPMLGVNLGTGTPQSAAELVEYVNGTLPTYYSNLRRKNGHEEPYNVKLWCLGNEMDGPWQICAKTAEEYGSIACSTAKMMKWLDPSIELVACGSSYRDMPTFGAWEREVLKHCYSDIDYLSLHQYYQNLDGDVPSFLSRSIDMGEFIDEVAGICREAKQVYGGGHDVFLSFDEWNVWYHFQKDCTEPPKWTFPRPIEEELYDMADALLVGCMLNTLINHADVVKIACMAQLVNTIAPIMTEPAGRAWVQTTYYPFLYASRFGRGDALHMEVSSPEYPCAIREKVPYVDCAAVRDESGNISLFLINRSIDEPLCCSISFDDDLTGRRVDWTTLCGCAPTAVNTADSAPVVPQKQGGAAFTGDALVLTLQPFSWNLVRLTI